MLAPCINACVSPAQRAAIITAAAARAAPCGCSLLAARHCSAHASSVQVLCAQREKSKWQVRACCLVGMHAVCSLCARMVRGSSCILLQPRGHVTTERIITQSKGVFINVA